MAQRSCEKKHRGSAKCGKATKINAILQLASSCRKPFSGIAMIGKVREAEALCSMWQLEIFAQRHEKTVSAHERPLAFERQVVVVGVLIRSWRCACVCLWLAVD